MKQISQILLTLLCISHWQINAMELAKETKLANQNATRLPFNEKHPFFPIIKEGILQKEILHYIDDPQDLLSIGRTCKALHTESKTFLKFLLEKIEEKIARFAMKKDLTITERNKNVLCFFFDYIMENKQPTKSTRCNKTKLMLLYVKKNGYDLDCPVDRDGITLALCLYYNQQPEVLEILLQSGASVTNDMKFLAQFTNNHKERIPHSPQWLECNKIVEKYHRPKETGSKEKKCLIS